MIVDEVELDQPGEVQWLMHLMGAPLLGQNSFRFEGQSGGVTGEFVYSSSGPVSLSTVQGFDDVDASEIKGLPPHHRLVATTKVARSHRLATVLTPYRKGHNKRLHHFMDDQGHATVLYFQDAQDRSYSIVWPKRF